jgi:hypothetical protein
MALTAEQQDQIDFQTAMDAGRRVHEISMEQRRARLEAVRLAKETLIEAARSKPVDQRDVSAADIVSFATTLENHVNGQ